MAVEKTKSNIFHTPGRVYLQRGLSKTKKGWYKGVFVEGKWEDRVFNLEKHLALVLTD